MYIELGRITFYIRLSFAVFFAFAANSSEGFSFVLTFLSAFFHELIHLFLLFRYGCKNAILDFYPGGVKIKTEGFSMLSYEKAVICTISAPVMNIIAGAVFFVLWKKAGSDIFYKAFAVNAVIGGGNLLPMQFLDGGRALNAFLMKYFSEEKVRRLCDFLSVFTLLLMLVVFLLMLINGKKYIFLLFFFFYCTLGCFSDKRDMSVT